VGLVSVARLVPEEPMAGDGALAPTRGSLSRLSITAAAGSTAGETGAAGCLMSRRMFAVRMKE